MQRTTITDIRNVAVAANDQDRAVEFYVDTLGFDKRVDADLGGGFRWIEVAPPGAEISIALIPATAGTPAGVDSGIRLAAADADADHAALRSRGVDVDDILRWPDVPPMFSFRDSDGNTLYVVEATDPEVDR